jgi:hypothetical protein
MLNKYSALSTHAYPHPMSSPAFFPVRFWLSALVLLTAPVSGATLPGHAEPGAPAVIAVKKPWVMRPADVNRPLAELAPRYDLVVYGATPGGVACAVRAAREGLQVLLVEHSPHVGGMFSSGLSVMDTLYAGSRAPLYDELRRGILDYYRITYGPDSPQFVASRPGHPKTYFEAHVAEHLVSAMLAAEPGITVMMGFYPVRAVREGAGIRTVTFQEKRGERTFVAAAGIFADCSYEADLAVVAGAKYRVGREGRDEFNEEHAGRIFLRKLPSFPPAGVDPAIIAKYKTLNLFHYDRWFEIVRPESTGVGDRVVQTYNIRAVLTTNPANRYIPDQPPPNYDPAVSREIWSQKPPYSQLLGPLPNQKYLWNMPEVIGPQNDYPDGDWAVRENVIELHRRATASMLYFLQNDDSVPAEVRAQWRNLGFARDEFPEYGHLPSEVYARETRRVMGRTIFTENDVRLTPGLERSPVQADSIGVTEWFVDSHASGTERVRDSIYEGEIYLNYISHPGQIPYRTILPEGFDNLLVPVCLSATHVGWGAIRLEPTWMGLGESAAHAAVLAVEQGVAPARINPDQLTRRLAAHRVLISFFNDVALDAAETWVPAVQYFGTQGFFGSYDAKPAGLVTAPLAAAWAEASVEWLAGKPVDLSARARRMLVAERAPGAPLTTDEFIAVLARELSKASIPFSPADLRARAGLGLNRPVTRGHACRLLLALGERPASTR